MSDNCVIDDDVDEDGVGNDIVVPAPLFVCNDDDESFDDKPHNDCDIDDNVDDDDVDSDDCIGRSSIGGSKVG